MTEWVLRITAFSVLGICSAAGCAAVFFTPFGTFIVLCGALVFRLMTGDDFISWGALCALGILYAAGEAAEFVLTAAGTRAFGGSRWSVLGAVAGGLVGALAGAFIAGIGAIPGTFLGIFIGACAVEIVRGRGAMASLKAGAGGARAYLQA